MYGEIGKACSQTTERLGLVEKLDFKSSIANQIEDLQKKLSEKQELLQLLEAHPEIERAFTLLKNY